MILDQGFGPWRAPARARFEFGNDATTQLRKLLDFNALIDARGAGYLIVADWRRYGLVPTIFKQN